jgi:hypothetical protein
MVRHLEGQLIHRHGFFVLNARVLATEELGMERRTLHRHNAIDVVGGLLLLTVAAALVGVALLVAAS